MSWSETEMAMMNHALIVTEITSTSKGQSALTGSESITPRRGNKTKPVWQTRPGSANAERSRNARICAVQARTTHRSHLAGGTPQRR
jgi:hypothetical protein